MIEKMCPYHGYKYPYVPRSYVLPHTVLIIRIVRNETELIREQCASAMARIVEIEVKSPYRHLYIHIFTI